ncbi:MAG: hypothetical protein IKE30_06755 [Clostridia bacterium]|nr:hypothetical protein [Clostridia bacterium]
MNEYPSAVTLYEDGVYRWRYEMDMRHNRYILRLIIRILLLLIGIPLLFVLAMALIRAVPLMNSGLPGDKIMFFIRDDLLLLAVMGGMLAGMILLTVIIYAIAAAALHGTWRLCYQMDESAVVLVRDGGKMKTISTFGAAVAVAGLAAGRPWDSLRIASTLAGANRSGTSRFDSLRRIRCFPENDVIDLREWFAMNQIFVPAEEYAFVRDFILERISEKARNRSAI